MRNTLDALRTSGLIADAYRRYLRSLLPIREPRIAEALAREVTGSRMLTKGPLLEATPPYETTLTPRQLVAEGVLHPGFLAPDGPAIPLDRPLYRHQEQALRKAVAGRNLVVATGTGSGKTESFLLPILNVLTAEHAAGELGPGVRALLLYPMNALANDQLKRLRELLKRSPHLTFGRYTGDTPESAREAADIFEALNPGAERLPNELLSREEMRANPPHLLLTNYAMLEYLLLRPADLDLFEGRYGGRWRFLALDEAHVYDGAKAAEVAMLLRRLHDRVGAGRRLQCIATSATVGDEPQAVMEFATKLFNAPFEWVPGDVSRQDLITPSRVKLPTGPFWGPLPAAQYRKLAELDDPADELLRLARSYGFPGDDAAQALAHEQSMSELRRRLAEKPAMFADLAQALFDPEDQPEEALAALVDVGSRIRDRGGSPVLSARYHLFARVTEGAFTCLTDAGPHVFLGRHEICPDCAGAVFEFGACKRCGAVYLTGTVRYADGGYVLTQRIKPDDRRVWLMLGDAPVLADEDDEVLESDRDELKADVAYLCVRCGGYQESSAPVCARDGCTGTALRLVRRLKTHKDRPSGCTACGARGVDMVRRFESGSEAAAAVLATALYQALPPATDEELADRPGEGRKLLSFSDSRQAAAFFAPYLESSYETIQHRRLILDGLRRATRDDEAVSVADLVYHVAKAADAAHVFERRMSRQQRERIVARWVMQELVALDDRQSLEGLGLLRVELDRERGWRLLPGLSALGLSPDECWDLLSELVRTVRQQGALTMPEEVDPRDEAFDPRRGPIYLRENGAEPGKKVLSWLPTRGTNRRLDYVTRLLERLGVAADPAEVLRGCWKQLTAQRDGWLAGMTVPRLGSVRQVDHLWLRLAPGDRQVYRCDRCQRISSASVRGVCTTLGCTGTLTEYTVPAAEHDDDHYRAVYRSLRPVPMVAREHTAQWTNLEAADIQQRFLRGEVNVLSCSTTFELGVDVGELQSVVLRNMPPTTANYVQRAGRAGRRTDSAALVVTYAQRRSHDLACYQDPVNMVAGKVRAPFVPLGNERIDRRHAHSIALAAFFRHAKTMNGETWKTAGEFFLPGPAGPAPVTQVKDFLIPVPAEVDRSLRAVLPPEVQRQIGVDDGRWAEKLLELLEDVRSQLAQDVEAFMERRSQAFKAGKDHLVQRYSKTINTLTQRDLLGFLANNNVLPKYGFPVDTVELRTGYSDEPVGAKLELTRDLSSAIYEYAPGGEIVAGGRLWRSAGVYRLPDRELVGEKYLICEHCRHFREVGDQPEMVCPMCGTLARMSVVEEYRVPEFGFVADRTARKVSTVPPQRSWHGATYVRSLAAQLDERHWRTGNGGTVVSRAGSRGQLIALSDGPSKAGYFICERCGAGVPVRRTGLPSAHRHLLRDIDCTGVMRRYTLAHRYETDILELTFDALAVPPEMDTPQWLSTLYALLEGATESLEISRDDIDGTLHPRPGRQVGLVLFDTVPGGAGNVLRIARALDRVVAAAHARVSGCDCGEETSCYGCLRSFRNQRVHDELSRRAALQVLRGLDGLKGPEGSGPMPDL